MITYILKSIALYHIGKREGVKAYGLAWVPGLRGWVLGGIADKHDAANGKEDRKFRIFNLVIAILNFAAIASVLVLSLVVARKLGNTYFQQNADALYFDMSLLQLQFYTVLGTLGIFTFFLVAAAGILSASAIAVNWVCRYKLFDLCRPSSVLVDIVVSAIFPGLGYAIVLMCNKNYRDDLEETIYRYERRI